MLLKRETLALLAVLGLGLLVRTEAQKLEGAASALQQMNAQKPVPTAAPGSRNSLEALHHILAIYRKRAPSLPPQESAHQWLAPAERYPTAKRARFFEDLREGLWKERSAPFFF